MKTRSIVFDHDREYGRDIRVAGVLALASVILAFRFAPQPRVASLRLRAPVEPEFVVNDVLPLPYDLPKPVPPSQRGVPLPSDNPEATTIGPNTDFNELKPDVTTTDIETDVPFPKVERKPKLVRGVMPEYPAMARTAGIEGKVVVSMVIDTLGNVTSAEVYASSGSVLLDRAAVEAAYKCGFSPGYQHDRPVVVRNVILPFNFKLQ